MRKFAAALCVMVLWACQVSAADWDVSKATPLPYAAVAADKDHRAKIKRTRMDVRIVLVTRDAGGKVVQLPDSSEATKEQLAATVIAAAKFYAQAPGIDFVGLVLDSQFGAGYGACQLATADYAPDGKGASGSDAWAWQMVQATDRGLSANELRIQRLWNALRGQFQNELGTDEPALRQAIAKQMGLPVAEVAFPLRELHDVPEAFINAVKAVPGWENRQ